MLYTAWREKPEENIRNMKTAWNADITGQDGAIPPRLPLDTGREAQK